jgi:hypothetical protein
MVLLLTLVIFYRIVKSEMPLLLKEMINDRRLIKLNQGRNKPPLERSRFAILALYQKPEELAQAYKFIPGLNKAGSLSDAKKGMRSTLINDIPLLDGDSYVPWHFSIIGGTKKIDQKVKKNIELMLNTVWDIYLDSEYNAIRYRKKQSKRVDSQRMENKKHLKINDL